MSVEERRYALLKHTHEGLGAGGSAGIPATDAQEFTSDGTWTKPAGAKTVTVYCVGGGGGGASGRRGAALTARCGGGAGEGSGRSGPLTLLADDLPSTVVVTVGTGGLGGGPISVNNTNGVSGSDGEVSSFGTYLRAIGGAGGSLGGSGTAANGGTGLGSGDQFMTSLVAQDGLNGGDGRSNANGVDGQSHTTDTWALQCGGGGGGGGISNADVEFSGGSSSPLSARYTASYTVAGGPPAIPGEHGVNFRGSMGVGGGGGGGGNRAAGGNGGFPGGGGGGGGAGINDVAASGPGGQGGGGVVVVITYF